MAQRNIVVLPYDEKWAEAFEEIRKEPADAAELKRHVAFRDYLRSHPEAVREYSRIKAEGAKLYPHDIDAYIEHKSSLIESIYREIGV